MNKKNFSVFLLLIFISIIVISGCGGGGGSNNSNNNNNTSVTFFCNVFRSDSLDYTEYSLPTTNFKTLSTASLSLSAYNAATPTTTNKAHYRRYIVFNSDISTTEAKTIIEAAGGTFHKALKQKERTYDAIFQRDISIADFNSDKVVEVYEPQLVSATDVSLMVNDKYYYEYQFNLSMLNIPSIWKNMSTTNECIKVAVVDSGILPDHEDLHDNLLAGYDCINDDNNPTDESTNGNYHGTMVAGIIAATSNNAIGIAGIGLNRIKIIPIRVMINGKGTSTDVAAGIDKAKELGAQVINLSLGSEFESLEITAAINRATAAGIIVVAASGNESSSNVCFPAQLTNVIGVGAVDFLCKRADYSNYGSGLNLMAPGIAIDVTKYTPIGLESYAAGTSIAAPHVSAIAALMLYHGIDKANVADILKNTAFSLGDSTYTGSGLLNPMAAINSDDLYTAANLKIRYRTVGSATYSYAFPSGGKVVIPNILPSTAYEIVAWIDSDNDNIIDSTEKYNEFSNFTSKEYSQIINFILPN